MLVVTALGGGALLRRGDSVITEGVRQNVRAAAAAFAAVAADCQLVICQGEGPQPGLLALQAAMFVQAETCPADVLRAHIDDTLGCLLEREIASLLPAERDVARISATIEVDPADPAFAAPSMPTGPVYLREEAERLTTRMHWTLRREGDKWRRVVASVQPSHVLELRPLQMLLERNTVVIATGGPGLPAVRAGTTARRLTGVECLVDRDLSAELLARELGADMFVLLTDVDAVYLDWGKPTQRAIRRASSEAIATMPLQAGSMKPKVAAACRFARATRRPAAIGRVPDLVRICRGEAGTTISATEADLTWAPEPGPLPIAMPLMKRRSSAGQSTGAHDGSGS